MTTASTPPGGPEMADQSTSATSAPQPIDGATALRLLREVVAERPDYVYKPPQDMGVCVYVADGKPSCIVGHVLSRAGCTSDQLHSLDMIGAIDATWLDVDWLELTDEAIRILGTAQGVQDGQSEPWSRALFAAEHKAAALGVTA